MTLVHASCRSCGEVTIFANDIIVHVCLTTGTRHYTFPCPTCTMREAKPLDPAIARRLIAAGAHSHGWRLPAELDEPHSGPPVTPDDVLDFHLALRDPSWIKRLAAQ